MQRVEQLLYRFLKAGNPQIRSNLMEGDKDKPTLSQPRMRNIKPRLVDFKIAYEQDIQIQRPRPIGNGCRTVATELLFNCQQFIEQRVRLEPRF